MLFTCIWYKNIKMSMNRNEYDKNKYEWITSNYELDRTFLKGKKLKKSLV